MRLSIPILHSNLLFILTRSAVQVLRSLTNHGSVVLVVAIRAKPNDGKRSTLLASTHASSVGTLNLQVFVGSDGYTVL